MNPKVDQSIFLQELSKIVGAKDLLTEVSDAYLHDWSAEVAGQPRCLVTPRSTEQVSKIMQLCTEYRVDVVPQGGLSGLAGGAVPSNDCVLLSLAKMDRIEHLDDVVGTLQVQAGAILQHIQEQVEAAGWMFALDLGARGSCQIGGNIATNAGGNRVIRYGVMRDLVLGLEVVLPDGQILNLLQSMKKNNTGLDLRQLFIGTEGTLGIITRAILKLHPGVAGANTALIAFDDYQDVLRFLKQAQAKFSGLVSAFELMWSDYYRVALETLGRTDQFESQHQYYLLFDVQSGNPELDYSRFEVLMEQVFDAGIVKNALLAKSDRETKNLWALRDSVSEILKVKAPTINFDVSVGIDKIGEFALQLEQSLRQKFPDLNTIFFGHIGDGNLHLMAGPVEGGEVVEEAIEADVYRITHLFSGSVSAEHGIGLHKKKWLAHSRSDAELNLMRMIKSVMDPNGIMNRGKILD